jgi:hypothetical protein
MQWPKRTASHDAGGPANVEAGDNTSDEALTLLTAVQKVRATDLLL